MDSTPEIIIFTMWKRVMSFSVISGRIHRNVPVVIDFNRKRAQTLYGCHLAAIKSTNFGDVAICKSLHISHFSLNFRELYGILNF